MDAVVDLMIHAPGQPYFTLTLTEILNLDLGTFEQLLERKYDMVQQK